MKTLNLKTIRLALFCIISTSIYGYAQQGNVTVNQDKRITKLLELKKEMNKNASDRYKIQIYSGNRVSAESTESDFKSKFDKFPTIVEFETPNYKVWAGNFRNRLEADRALKEIKLKFPNAFVFQPKK
ncbi:SPOR domain-containing protein [Flavobacteriaceae bacterium XHP0103]|uniref:SPOR domain-containing protein n=1 Tax=Marixanthotalea marina TaxID=2844359 RepID=UPI002989EBF5|nr:SPOR domain-containing protein [Marixanthotalea marina]MBU3820898.1 SPOR domain-containing protein [Marixanthotalea marina]